jgi:hypothetical protein
LVFLKKEFNIKNNYWLFERRDWLFERRDWLLFLLKAIVFDTKKLLL